MRATFAALALVLPASGLAADAGWKTVRAEADGLVLESRPAPDTSMPELRITAVTAATPGALVASAWEFRQEGMQTKYLSKRRVLAEADGERTLFLEYQPPIISPRQCVLREKRWADAATGARHLTFRKLPFTPAAGFAAFAQLRGKWSFAPDGRGKTRVTYVVLIDVGGVPAVLARAAQQDAAVATVREVVERAEAELSQHAR